MNEKQIYEYFGNHIIYNFKGNKQDFISAFIDKNINYIITNYSIYFISSEKLETDERTVIFADNTQGVV